MRRLSQTFDLTIIFGLTLAGFYQFSMIVIVVGSGALAVSPITRSFAMARSRPNVDTCHILRNIKIDAFLQAVLEEKSQIEKTVSRLAIRTIQRAMAMTTSGALRQT